MLGRWKCRLGWHDWRVAVRSFIGPDFYRCARCRAWDCDEP
jgi:hypothetical protein